MEEYFYCITNEIYVTKQRYTMIEELDTNAVWSAVWSAVENEVRNEVRKELK